MKKYILKRMMYMVILIFVLSFMIFSIYNLIPYDRAMSEAKTDVQNDSNLNFDDRYAHYQKLYGTDGNLMQRYLRWMGLSPFFEGEFNGREYVGGFNGILQGNFGYSSIYGKDVIDVIKEPMKNTIFINVLTTILALAITIPLGIFCAVKKGTKRDTAVQVGTIVGYSLPTFLIAILFIWLFSATLGFFPISGMETPGNDYTGIQALLDRLYYMSLPIIVMTFCSLGGMTRYVRGAMIESLSMDCIKTARSKGLREKTVIYSHAWRNALIPIVTLVIGWFLAIFSGSIMIENIFALNGVGKIYIDSLTLSDFEVVLFLQMFYITISLLGNLIIDIVYGFIDPRIRVSK